MRQFFKSIFKPVFSSVFESPAFNVDAVGDYSDDGYLMTFEKNRVSEATSA